MLGAPGAVRFATCSGLAGLSDFLPSCDERRLAIPFAPLGNRVSPMMEKSVDPEPGRYVSLTAFACGSTPSFKPIRVCVMYVENIDREWDLEARPDLLEASVEKRKIDPVSALSELEQLAAKGSALAMLYVGDSYANGRGVPRNVELGESWYRKAADCGSIEAAHRLAFFEFCRKNFPAMMRLLEELSRRGFIPETYCLGSIYFHGNGIEKDLKEAVRYWKIAEQGGHLIARQAISIVERSGDLGVWKILMGYSKLLVLLIPYVSVSMKNPRSDRLRVW